MKIHILLNMKTFCCLLIYHTTNYKFCN